MPSWYVYSSGFTSSHLHDSSWWNMCESCNMVKMVEVHPSEFLVCGKMSSCWNNRFSLNTLNWDKFIAYLLLKSLINLCIFLGQQQNWCLKAPESLIQSRAQVAVCVAFYMGCISKQEHKELTWKVHSWQISLQELGQGV